ncbi:MAG: hypothetical protein L3J65_08915 [Robiginitomaculum sp.]|nr:hypothetical protein [Robiginitomaculum sp.]
MKKLGIYLVGTLFCLFSMFSPIAIAQQAEERIDAQKPPVIVEKPVEKPVLLAELIPEFKVTLEGEVLETEVSRDANGTLLIRAEPIFTGLNDIFEYDVEGGVLVVQRSQDGVVMELYTDTGIVKANGKALGKLKQYGQISVGSINLTPNAIAVMSGAIGKIDADENKVDFNLDPRLKVATGFEIFVEDIPLGNLEPGPKAIGSVMLLPLRPIAKELGHTIQIIDGGASIRVKRAQDSAVFELNLDTGLVKLNDRPVGVSKDVTYFDKINLLLPLGTIEALTGVHVSVEGGSRINISLDARLKGAVQPTAKINEVTKETPFTLETIQLHTGTDTINTVDVDFRVKGFNGRMRYEIPDLPTNAREAQPSWLSLDYAHVKGGYGSLGDLSTDLRQLDGVGLRRIRGVSYAKESDKGRWALAAGVPTSGSTKISEDQSRLKFSGLTAGARYASKDGWEAGLSVKSDGLSDDKMAVLSAISGRLGRKRDKKLRWNVQADVGYFNGAAREKSVDVRTNIDARYAVSKKINVDVFASYDGAEFLRSDLDAEQLAQQENVDTGGSTEDEQFVPDTRKRGQDFASYGAAVQMTAGQTLGPFERPAISARYGHTQSGVFSKNGNDTSTDTYGVSVNTSLRKIGTNISADYTAYTQKLADGSTETGDQLTARIFQDTKYITARGQYTSNRKGSAARINRFDAQLTAKPYNLSLPKDAVLSISPSISGSWSKDNNFTRGGVVANLNSGQVLGKKTKLTASMGILQSFSGQASDKSDKFLTVSVGRELRINKNLSMGLSYRNNLQGDQRLGIFLDGRFDFNEKRKFRASDEGRGVLKGRAFLDKNRDGIKQEDEPGIGGALIRVRQSSMSLRTDAAGYFTIQNIKVGIHELQIDGRSLPLGYSLAENVSTKASIHDGHITDLLLPIVQRGQIRGFAFIDENGDGAHNKGEKRLEGARLSLTDTADAGNHFEIYATSFGQYAFDDLPSGEYELVITKTNSSLGDPSHTPVIINLAEAEDLMARINIAAIATNAVQMAGQNSEPKNTLASGVGGRVGEQGEEIPPPDIGDENIIVVSPAP